MSTTIKRVALVAVAALGLGVLSVAPSTAANQGDQLVLSATTGTQETSDTATAGSATATLSFLASAAGDSMSVTASLVSFPAGNTALPVFDLVETSTGTIQASSVAGAANPAGPRTGLVQWVSATASGTTSAKFKVYMNAPSVVGTYVVKLTPAVVAGGGSLNATAQTLTITVTQKAASDTTVSAATSTSILNVGETSSATADAVVTGDKTLPATNNAAAGTIAVTLKNAAGTTLTTAESYTAQVLSGPGLLGSGAQAVTHSFSAAGRAITVKAGDVVGVFPDGSSGVSKIEIRTAAGVLIATESVTFYGDIASIVATVAIPVIGTTAANSVTAKAYDAAGTLVSSGSLYFVSSNTAVIASNTAGASIDATTGVATFSIAGLTAGTASITVGNKTTASTVSAAAVSVRVGSSTPASVTVTTDKASYAPGEKATLSVKLFDAAGLALADGAYGAIFATGGIVGSYTITGDTTTALGVYNLASGTKDYTVYMPVTEGDVKFSWTTGTGLATANQGVAGSVTVAVSSTGTSAAIDAANEAAQAASDATDAALAAADAADAATTKAQEAVDAVATLSAQVSKLITALKAQITTLTNLVIKIQKKVRA